MRGGDVSTRSSKRNGRTDLPRSWKKNKQRVCNEGETIELLALDDLHQESNKGVWSELSEEVASDLSKIVVSLVVVHEHKVLFACSGFAVDCDGDAARFMTSASLVKALNDKRKDHDNKIEVRNEDHVVEGFLGEYDLKDNTASVIVKKFCDFCTIGFNHALKLQPHSKVCEGGPLFDFDGEFVGMILSFSSRKTLFLPKFEVFDILMVYESLDENEMEFPALDSSKTVRVGEVSIAEVSLSCKEVVDKHQSKDLESLGYPKPSESMLNDEIILAHNFEEPFGDSYDTGVWSGISQPVASNIRDNIVALASFNGGKRVFACTGLFIEWNGRITILTSASLIRDYSCQTRDYSCEHKIVENLRIQVSRPNEEHADGTLEHYNLHYNIALISVKDFCPTEPVKIQYRGCGNFELLAVGCIFRSGRLMAQKGVLSPFPVSYGCEYLRYCTCTISKAGTGGPLLDFDGKFVGMNFYNKYNSVGTPYLPWNVIQEVLEHFKGKRTVAEGGYDVSPFRFPDWTLPCDPSKFCNRWPVVFPEWWRPKDLSRFEYEIYRTRPQYMLL